MAAKPIGSGVRRRRRVLARFKGVSVRAVPTHVAAEAEESVCGLRYPADRDDPTGIIIPVGKSL
jgi:hypothetical protein